MHPLGVNGDKWGWREAGILEELKLENAANNPQRSWDMWDLMLYDKCVTEPNLTLLLDTAVYSADTDGGKIAAVYARSDKTLKIYRIKAKVYIDSHGPYVAPCDGVRRRAYERQRGVREIRRAARRHL